MTRLSEILEMVDNMPPFPKVAQRVIELLRSPDVSLRDLAQVIQLDQAITANVLRLCNSAFFGRPREISSLSEALVVLGHDTLREIIVTSSSARFLKPKAAGYDLDEGELWLHAVSTALMAKQLVCYIPGVDAGMAYTTGLLHDIGKVLLSRFVADDLRQIILLVTNEKIPFATAEARVLGANHADLGAMILEKWQFAPEMVAAVRAHHDQEAFNLAPLTALVALSNTLTAFTGIGGGVDTMASQINGSAIQRFGLTQEKLDLCLANLVGQMDEIRKMLALV